jgi:hypothetical protein
MAGQAACCQRGIVCVIIAFQLDTTRLTACHVYGVTAEIIPVEDERFMRTRKALDRLRRVKAEGSVHSNRAPAASSLPEELSRQVHIHVSVQALRVEYKPGLFALFCAERGMRRAAAFDRFSVEITADAPDGDVPALIEGIAALSDIIPSYGVGEADDGSASGQRVAPTCVDIGDGDASPQRHRSTAALDIWV